jgi:hypothetical protein
MKFCPRCGLADVKEAAADTSPLDITTNGRTYRILDRIAIGSICAVYRCRFKDAATEVEAIVKIARDARTNALLVNEAAVLRQLHAADGAARFTPFLPAVEASFSYGDDPSSPPRQVNVLRMHEEIRSPDELYALSEIRDQYPTGLDGRDVAWMWRRLLSILGFAHAQSVVHGAVLPPHVLIEPREHKLMLIDWCCAVADAQNNRHPLTIISGGHASWYKRQGATKTPPTPELDIAFGVRCMIELLGGDPVSADFPPTVDPALKRYFQRCLGGGSGPRLDAWKLLDDFDHLIEALWGARQFRPLTMPPKAKT